MSLTVPELPEPRMVPRPEDFEHVRQQLLLIEHVYARSQARAQGVEFHEGADACARRRALIGEILEWIESRQDLGELVRASVATVVTLPPGGYLG